MAYDPFLDAPVWGAKAIARVLNLKNENGEPDERAAYYGLEQGHYDATKIGKQWASTPRRLLAPHLSHLAT